MTTFSPKNLFTVKNNLGFSAQVCYHNASPELDEDSFRELWGTSDQPAPIEEYSGFAERLVEQITVSSDATDEAKLNARLALACGYANHTTEGNVTTRHRYLNTFV